MALAIGFSTFLGSSNLKQFRRSIRKAKRFKCSLRRNLLGDLFAWPLASAIRRTFNPDFNLKNLGMIRSAGRNRHILRCTQLLSLRPFLQTALRIINLGPLDNAFFNTIQQGFHEFFHSRHTLVKEQGSDQGFKRRTKQVVAVASTRSDLAAKILDDWKKFVPKFVKVMPQDYKRVLSAASQAEREGRDVNEAVMAAAHG